MFGGRMAARRHKDMKRVLEKQITRTKVFSEEFFGVFFGRDFSGIVLYGVDVIPRIVVCRQ